ncbi:MAG: helix-turn-helix domain-containing protein [Clostridium sp.]|nr:helix-turn-helix domain-containing protein [Clostridium sp.]
MDQEKFGTLLRQLRKERGLTQLCLAREIGVSNKAISKWETGQGCPDVSLLPELGRFLGVDLESLLSGSLDSKQKGEATMKKLQLYVCPQCGNLVTSMTEAGVSCCGKRLASLEPKKVREEEKLSVEKIETDYFISSEHPMTKTHYISFVALITGESLVVRRLYPEWDLQTRLPCLGHGRLIWYCTEHGLFQQLI